jgi:hypothetical protein
MSVGLLGTPRRCLTLLMCAVAVAVVIPAGLSQADSGSGSDVWGPLHRPLYLVPGHVRCPVSAPAQESGFPVAVREMGTRLFGSGPVYLRLSTARGLAVLDMRFSRTLNDLRGQQTPWLVRPGYDGPLLIRAWRPDASGKITKIGIGNEQQAELRVRSSKLRARSVAGGWRGFPSTTWVSGPGCRIWQIDGLTFSQTIVASVRY